MWCILTVGLVTLNLFDYLLTAILVRVGGVEIEANPLARGVCENHGLVGMFVFKLAVIAFVVIVIHVLRVRRPATARRLLGGFCGLMLGVVVYNFWLVGLCFDLSP